MCLLYILILSYVLVLLYLYKVGIIIIIIITLSLINILIGLISKYFIKELLLISIWKDGNMMYIYTSLGVGNSYNWFLPSLPSPFIYFR